MLKYTQGNLLEAPVEALVNTVNEVGVMGKGIALMFRDAFPENTKAYEAACREGAVRVGQMFVTRTGDVVGPKWIINFPTKKHWRQPSKMEWVRLGLKDLVYVVRTEQIRSLALPPLGCGNGGLEWSQVRREIEAGLAELADGGTEIVVYEPTSAYQNAPKRAGVEALTPARALIAELVREYCVLGIECTNLEVQKLAWFLQRSIRQLQLPDPLSLTFVANKYGPYADQLRHLLDGLDGSYLHCEKRLSDAGPFDRIWFEDERRPAVQAFLKSDAANEFASALEQTRALIDGFESPLGMELLATVDWLLVAEHREPTIAGLRDGLKHWAGGTASARRKNKLFDDRLLELALERLGRITA